MNRRKRIEDMTNDEFRQLVKDVAGERGKEPKRDPRFSERVDEPTPSGGDYSIAYYYDKDGHPCTKSQASAVNILEFTADGRRVNETYGRLGK